MTLNGEMTQPPARLAATVSASVPASVRQSQALIRTQHSSMPRSDRSGATVSA